MSDIEYAADDIMQYVADVLFQFSSLNERKAIEALVGEKMNNIIVNDFKAYETMLKNRIAQLEEQLAGKPIPNTHSEKEYLELLARYNKLLTTKCKFADIDEEDLNIDALEQAQKIKNLKRQNSIQQKKIDEYKRKVCKTLLDINKSL